MISRITNLNILLKTNNLYDTTNSLIHEFKVLHKGRREPFKIPFLMVYYFLFIQVGCPDVFWVSVLHVNQLLTVSPPWRSG